MVGQARALSGLLRFLSGGCGDGRCGNGAGAEGRDWQEADGNAEERQCERLPCAAEQIGPDLEEI